MAELISQENAWKPTLVSTTSKLYKKLTTPIRISLPTSSVIFFLISFSLLSISLLSLSSQHSTFWFLLSNSIIFFIAAVDSNSFNPNPDYCNEYQLTTTRTTTTRTTDWTVESRCSPADSEEKSETPLLAIAENDKTSAKSSADPSLKFRRRRTKSEDAVVHEKMLLRSTTMANGSETCGLDDDAAGADHLSNMSDEELNRRIEEFIRKFNREILLQEMKESEEKDKEM